MRNAVVIVKNIDGAGFESRPDVLLVRWPLASGLSLPSLGFPPGSDGDRMHTPVLLRNDNELVRAEHLAHYPAHGKRLEHGCHLWL